MGDEHTPCPRDLRFLISIVNTIADPIFVKDRGHRFVLVNDALCELVGHTREELIGRGDADFFPPEQACVFYETDDAVLRTGVESVNEEDLTDLSGRTHVLVTKKSRLLDETGSAFVVGVIRDVSERKRAEEERERLVRSLSEALVEVKTLRDFLPICAYCRKIRDDRDYWQQIEQYITEHTGSRFSHGICPDCYTRHVQPQIDALKVGED